MLRHVFIALSAILLCGGLVLAQPQMGEVQGFVHLSNGRPADDADVNLDAVDGGHDHFHAHTETRGNGDFSFLMVPPGTYTVTAFKPFQGMASDVIDVVAHQTTHVTLTLQDPDSGHGGGLTPVDLQGNTIVIAPDSLHRATQYFLDTNNDGTPDYRLSFGPPWYNPEGGAHRPNNGDRITIHGGLFSYDSPPMVIVWEINGHFWRDPVHGGHGGYGGDHGSGCDPDSVTRVELAGTAIVTNIPGWHGEHHSYSLDVNQDSLPDYLLDFGADDYDPGNGALRPQNGESDSIVGGQIDCPGAPHPIVVVYEINGLFWRQPGDTSGMGPMNPNSAREPVPIGTPVSYLTAHNYPNPFNPVTTISYSVPVAGRVKIAVFDITGREVTKLVNEFQTSGSYAVAWDGSAFASGIYFYRVAVSGLSFTSRMVLMK